MTPIHIILRKDFPLAGIETPLPAEDVAEQTNLKVAAAPMMGGPFVSSGDGKMSQTEPRLKTKAGTKKKKIIIRIRRTILWRS